MNLTFFQRAVPALCAEGHTSAGGSESNFEILLNVILRTVLLLNSYTVSVPAEALSQPTSINAIGIQFYHLK